MSRSFLLQDWTTIRSSLNATFVQDPSDWLDLDGFSDVVCWVDVAEVTPPGGLSRNWLQLQLMTAPSFDGAYFVPIAPATNIGTQAPYVQASTSPTIVRSAQSTVSNNLMRYLRWTITPSTSGAWDLTFRIRAIAARSATFAPPLIAGCVAWYRADLGIVLSPGTATILNWNDQSGTNDANKNLTAGVSPTLNVGDANYMGQTTVSFVRASGTYLTSGTWTSALAQPDTWIVVGHTTSASQNEIAIESNDGASHGQNVMRTSANELQISATTALTTSTSGTSLWNAPSVLLAEFQGTLSKLYFNNFTTPLVTVGGPGGNASQPSLTIGSSDKSIGLGSYWDGTMAEIIGYSGTLSSTAKAQLRQYLRGRYGIAIG